MKLKFFIFLSIYFILPIKDLWALRLEEARVTVPESNMVITSDEDMVGISAPLQDPLATTAPNALFYEEPIFIAIGIFVILSAAFLVLLKLRK